MDTDRAEQTATGYDVAWKDTANNQYSVWSTDSSGYYLSNIVAVGPGSSSALQSIESVFHQDLDGDGTIGLHSPILASNAKAGLATSPLIGGQSFQFARNFEKAGGANPAQAIDAIELPRDIYVEVNALMTALHEPSQLPIADANQQHLTPALWFAHHDGFHFV